MRRTTYYWLSALLLWCLVLLAFRRVYWNSHGYFFLPFNLFLATLPLALSHLVVRRTEWREKVLLGAIWLLFFPNAPYLLTDLIHLGPKRVAPPLYDLVMLLSYAGAGAALGFLSLRQMQNEVAERGWPRLSWCLAIGSLFLGSFGIYLGRVVRLNSWDVLARPWHLLKATLEPLINPIDHLPTWCLVISLGVLLSLGYGFFAQTEGVTERAGR